MQNTYEVLNFIYISISYMDSTKITAKYVPHFFQHNVKFDLCPESKSRTASLFHNGGGKSIILCTSVMNLNNLKEDISSTDFC